MQSAYNNKDGKQAGKELLKDKEFRDKTAAMKDQYGKNEDAIEMNKTFVQDITTLYRTANEPLFSNKFN